MHIKCLREKVKKLTKETAIALEPPCEQPYMCEHVCLGRNNLNRM